MGEKVADISNASAKLSLLANLLTCRDHKYIDMSY